MAAVHFDASTSDDARRQRLYAGDIFISSASDASRAMAELENMLEEALLPHDPRTFTST